MNSHFLHSTNQSKKGFNGILLIMDGGSLKAQKVIMGSFAILNLAKGRDAPPPSNITQ
jgi:hypothetical protein